MQSVMEIIPLQITQRYTVVSKINNNNNNNNNNVEVGKFEMGQSYGHLT
jgi:hypothetical protein